MATTAVIPYTTLLQQFKAAPPGKLYCLHGGASVFRLSLYAAGHALLNGVPITLIDGTNRFDVYYLADFARTVARRYHHQRNPTPEELLERMFVARAFTCYQMEATITERLPVFLRRSRSPVVIIFGLLDTFYDEQAPMFEVKASLQRITAALHRLKRGNISVLLASLDMKLESKERNGLFPRLMSAMDQVFSVTEHEGTVRILCEPTGRQECRTTNGSRRVIRGRVMYGKNSTDIHAGNRTGDGELVKVPAGAPQRRPGGAR